MTDEQEEPKGKASPRARTSQTSKSPEAPPWVADPAAAKLVGTAAAAIGLSVEDLANLIVDAGITALPPSDGITGRYTLKELGVRLWGTMQQEPRQMRAKWFGGLTPTQQTAVIVTLRDRGFSSQVIAQDFKIALMDVQRTWNKHADDLGAQVVGLRLNTIAGNLQLMAERATQGAMEKGDHASMWRITKELAKMLQELGIVDRAIHKVEVTHKFDEEKQAELDKMLAIERKKAAQLENIKAIEAVEVEGDPMPEEMTDGQA